MGYGGRSGFLSFNSHGGESCSGGGFELVLGSFVPPTPPPLEESAIYSGLAVVTTFPSRM